VLLRGDGAAQAWEVSIPTLPPVDIASGDVDLPPPPPDQQQQEQPIAGGRIMIDNQVVRLRNGRVFLPNGVQIVGAMPQQPPRPGGAEQIDHIRPVGDRVLVATSGGRVAAVELSNGNIAWQSRMTDAPLQQVVTNDDFIAARFV
jgi:hypothetical protein